MPIDGVKYDACFVWNTFFTSTSRFDANACIYGPKNIFLGTEKPTPIVPHMLKVCDSQIKDRLFQTFQPLESLPADREKLIEEKIKIKTLSTKKAPIEGVPSTFFVTLVLCRQ